jgi:hypothetical protein
MAKTSAETVLIRVVDHRDRNWNRNHSAKDYSLKITLSLATQFGCWSSPLPKQLVD